MSAQQQQLQWPDGYDRTDPDDREPYPGDLSLTHREAFESIVEELERWGKTDVEIETASTHYANDPNIPHKSGDPDDVGVVAYYRDLEAHSSEQSAIACDRWESHRENARAISLWIRRIRLADRCGVETAREIDEVAQLPPADGDVQGGRGEAVAAPPAPSQEDILGDEEPHEVLDVQPDAPDEIVQAAFRAQVKDLEGHPDTGGSSGRFRKLEKAREVMLDD
ncbi:J domain-containing protein [Natrinema thermotolerans]|uniref:J domain-containing protein n=1 Tax=Natrinema thermotolerans TaxID=121872 RepID=UPI0006784547|nr:J domain-containing protein [Natrinema thermotolerans]QCC57386.1 J domain-containing protein [Natrinema thermotolerans]